MAIVRKEPKDIDGLGPFGIIGEALKLFSAHAKVFILTQLTLILPLVIVSVVVNYFLLFTPPNINRPSLLAGPTGPYLRLVLLTLLPSLVGVIVSSVAFSLSQSTTLYCVGLHYAGQPVSFIDALRASVPRLWMRLVLTTTPASVLFMAAIQLVTIGCAMLLIQYTAAVTLLISGILEVFSLVAAVYFGTIIMIASGVAVLEEDYGWAAMKKSLKLLKGKVKVAVLFQLLWMVPTTIPAIFVLSLQKKKGDVSPWTLVRLLLGTIVYVVWMTCVSELHFLCSGVQYVSFKAYHNESLARSLYEKRTTEGTYASIEDGSNVALIGGQPANNPK